MPELELKRVDGDIVVIPDNMLNDLDFIPLVEQNLPIDVLDTVLNFHHGKNIDLTDYAREGYSARQLKLIGLGLEHNIPNSEYFDADNLECSLAKLISIVYKLDFKVYKDYKFETLEAILYALENGVKLDYFNNYTYTNNQIYQLVDGYINGVDLRPFILEPYTKEQLYFIVRGLKEGVSVGEYAKPEYSAETMKDKYLKLYNKKNSPREALMERIVISIEADAVQLYETSKGSNYYAGFKLDDIKNVLINSCFKDELVIAMKDKFESDGVIGCLDYFISLYAPTFNELREVIHKMRFPENPLSICDELYEFFIASQEIRENLLYKDCKAASSFIVDYARFKHKTIDEALLLAMNYKL